MAESQLFLDALLISIYRFGADEQLLTNLRRGIPLRDVTQDVALTLGELLEPLALGSIPDKNIQFISALLLAAAEHLIEIERNPKVTMVTDKIQKYIEELIDLHDEAK